MRFRTGSSRRPHSGRLRWNRYPCRKGTPGKCVGPFQPRQEAHPEGHRPEPSLAPGSQTGRGVAEQLPPENVRFSVLRAAFPG